MWKRLACAVLLFALFAGSLGFNGNGNDIVFEDKNSGGISNNSTGKILGLSKKEFILTMYKSSQEKPLHTSKTVNTSFTCFFYLLFQDLHRSGHSVCAFLLLFLLLHFAVHEDKAA